MLHAAHIAVERLDFGLGEVQFFNERIGFCVIGGAVIKAISGVGNIALVVAKVYLPVSCNLSAEVEEFSIHGAVTGGLNGYVLAGLVFAVDVIHIHSFELVEKTNCRLGVVVTVRNRVVNLRDVVEIFDKSVV